VGVLPVRLERGAPDLLSDPNPVDGYGLVAEKADRRRGGDRPQVPDRDGT
jgi:hypothetical protein